MRTNEERIIEFKKSMEEVIEKTNQAADILVDEENYADQDNDTRELEVQLSDVLHQLHFIMEEIDKM